MRLNLLFTGIMMAITVAVSAQQTHPYKASLTYTLGHDTTDIANMELDGNNFKLTIVTTAPSVNVSKINGTFFPDGQLKRLEGYSYDPVKEHDSLIYTYKLRYDRDTTFIETKSAARTGLRKYPVKIAVANAFGGDALLFIPTLLTHFAPKHTGDSLISHHIVFNSPRKFIIKRTGNDRLVFGSSVMGMFTAYLDRSGNIRSVDGIGTSFNIVGKAGKYLKMDDVIASAVKQQKLHPKPVIVNKLDSVIADINQNRVKIIYSRPSVRNRQIFGAVVPWNRVWRTGADAATRIVLEKAVSINGKVLPAGEYSIFTLPSPDGWTLLFNSKANIWGTEYDANSDVLKVPMMLTTLTDPVELLTIAITPKSSNQAELSVSWDKVKVFVSLRFD